MTLNYPNSPPSQQLLYPPTPQEYADALEQLSRNAQTQIRTPGALTSNLLADALLQYGQDRAKRQQPYATVVGFTPTSGSADPGSGPQTSLAPGFQSS